MTIVRTALLSGCAWLLTMAAPAQAALIYDFQLNGDFNNAAGPGEITGSGGTLGATGYTFKANQGLSIALPQALSVYTIETRFRFDGDSYGLNKVVDFKNRTDDNGVYFANKVLIHYPWGSHGGPLIASGEMATIAVSRNAQGVVAHFVNGVETLRFQDGGGAIFDQGFINMFMDDTVYADQSRPGFADYVKVYDTANFTSAVPEPASWAMMIVGFGAVGSLVRASRRRSALSAA